jgi:hypothetical protein
VVFAAAFPTVHGVFPCLPWYPVSCLSWYRGESIVKDHHQVFGAQGLAAMMAHRDGFLTLIVALGAFPAHYRVILSH